MTDSPPTPKALSRDAIRAIDQAAWERFGLSGLVLMENAGRGAADLLQASFKDGKPIDGPVVIVAYRGNNGGDGFVLARHLDGCGVDVRVVLVCDPESVSGDAAANLAILRKTSVPVLVMADPQDDDLDATLADASWVVDALLGTGASGPLRPPLDRVVRAMNRTTAKKLALDLPTGLDADTGEAADPTFRADETITFAASKIGLTRPEAMAYAGRVTVAPIGVPKELLAGPCAS